MQATLAWVREQTSRSGGPELETHLRWLFLTYPSSHTDRLAWLEAELRKDATLKVSLLPDFMAKGHTCIQIKWYDTKPRNFTVWMHGDKKPPAAA